MSISALKAQMPSEHHAALDAAVAGYSADEQVQIGGGLAALIALLKQFGLTINWGCILAVLPQVVPAFSSPALLIALVMAYYSCAHPAPVPAP